MPLFSRLGARRGDAEPAAPLPPLPPPGVLRRERRALVKLREERIRDLGGLMLEMYRRDVFRDDLIREQCSDLVAIEARLEELDWLLSSGKQPPPTPVCSCGAPVPWGARFCGNCGRAVGETLACADCGAPLAGDAQFCGNCGRATAIVAEPAEVVAELEPEPAARAADGWER